MTTSLLSCVLSAVCLLHNVLFTASLTSSTLQDVTSQPPSSVTSQFEPGTRLVHLAVDSETGVVYIGAVNNIYQLQAGSLLLLEQSVTGPVPDNPQCYEPLTFGSSPHCNSSATIAQLRTKQTDNYNQVLVIDKQHQQLITCGSVFQGTCQTRDLRNISNCISFFGSSAAKNLFVASNDATRSSVAFIGPGTSQFTSRSRLRSSSRQQDTPGEIQDTVLYVGNVFTGSRESEYMIRQFSVGITTRSLTGPRTFDVYHVEPDVSGIIDGTFASLTLAAATKYKVEYVTGFSVGGYSYFLTIQPRVYSGATTSSPLATKIVQICQKDRYYDSYVEMPLNCQVTDQIFTRVQAATLVKPSTDLATSLNITTQDDILIAAFYSLGGATSRLSPGGASSSALCVYRLIDIRQTAANNIQRCHSNSTDTVGPQFYRPGSTSEYCTTSQSVSITENYCGRTSANTINRNSPLSGTIPVQSSFSFIVSGSRITSLTASVVDNHTVVFAGTANGRLRKVLLNNVDNPVFDDILVSNDGFAIGRDMVLSSTGSYLFLMTNTTVYKQPVADCQRFTTCQQCLAARSPLCGWCALLARCVGRLDCPNSELPARWQSLVSGRYNACTSVTHVEPSSQLSVTQSNNLTLSVTFLPLPLNNETFVCLFQPMLSSTISSDVTSTSVRPSTATVVSLGQIVCQRPPTIHTIHDHTNVSLVLQVLPSGVHFTQTLLTYYNCSSHTRCSECTSSTWGCVWCLYDNQCIDNFSSCSHTISQTQLCPRVIESEEILIESDSVLNVFIETFNLPQLNDAGFFCQLLLPSDDVVNLPATAINNSRIVCSEFEFISHSSSADNILVFVGWNKLFIIEGYSTITVYSCSSMSNADCSTCLSLHHNASTSRFNCAWCDGVCTSDVDVCDNLSSFQCPAPYITQVSPQSGPVEGGTPLTITGTNLGYQPSQLSITIGDVPCIVIPSEYIVSVRVVCNTSRVVTSAVNEINVTVSEIVVAIWRDVRHRSFYYQDPQLFGIFPTSGPVDGGTSVSINGNQLDTGASQVVYFSNMLCNMTHVSDHHIVFITPPASHMKRVVRDVTSSSSHDVMVLFDNAARHMNVVFEFTDNPVVTDISPLSSFSNGSCRIVVSGTNLNCCQTNILQLTNHNKSFSITPVSVSASQLVFLSPYVPLAASDRPPMKFNISLLMDSVESVRNLKSALRTFTVYNNPQINTFTNDLKEYRGEILTLQGSALLTTCMNSVADVTVLIGNELCNITLITDTELQCKPPDYQPLGFNTLGQPDVSVLPRVHVRVGGLYFNVGSLQYVQSTSGVYTVSGWWPVIVGVCGGLLVVTIVILAVIFVRKSSYSERQYLRLQGQLDALESSVRNECKQAFAELQTEVLDISTDISDVGVPFWDYNTYATKLLFNVHSDYQLMQQTSDSMTRNCGVLSPTLNRFNQLLNSKFFLLIFIQTLEQQKDFTVIDKAKVASLLMSVLVDDMIYATDIIKVLLLRFIENSIEKKTHKMLLRRMESIVEKLLAHWLSLCMYNHVRHGATGKVLFRLYQAIKRQTEKGPVDAITGEARYCMTEDRLLREKIEHKFIMVTVQCGNVINQHSTMNGGSLVTAGAGAAGGGGGGDGGIAGVTCKLLDCDTITQAKSKILDVLYATVPFSQRPSVHSIDLWLKLGRHSSVPLCDEDFTTNVNNGWKQVNTLSHYNVNDHSVFIVVDHTCSVTQDECIASPRVQRTGSGSVELDAGLTASHTIKVKDKNPDRFCHIVKRDDSSTNNNSRSTKVVVSEIFLTRLLSTKMTLQCFIDELFQSLLQVDNSLRIPIKYLFDIFDAAAKHYGISDPEIIHAWKSNSLPLRFWVNVIQNPEFLFDVDTSPVVNSSLTVVAQTLMDSCSTHEYKLGKDSPSTKLLFAKDIPRYRQLVTQFYTDIQELSPPVTDTEMKQFMLCMSKTNITQFNQQKSLEELYQYANKYKAEIQSALNDDLTASNMKLADRFLCLDSARHVCDDVTDDVTVCDDVLLSFV